MSVGGFRRLWDLKNQAILLLLRTYETEWIFDPTRQQSRTHVHSAHKRNGDNQAQEPGWERRKKGFVREVREPEILLFLTLHTQ